MRTHRKRCEIPPAPGSQTFHLQDRETIVPCTPCGCGVYYTAQADQHRVLVHGRCFNLYPCLGDSLTGHLRPIPPGPSLRFFFLPTQGTQLNTHLVQSPYFSFLTIDPKISKQLLWTPVTQMSHVTFAPQEGSPAGERPPSRTTVDIKRCLVTSR